MAEEKQVTKTTETHTTITEMRGNPPPLAGAPTTKTLPATWVSRTTARLEGEVTPNKAPTQCWFEYGRTPNLGQTTASVSLGDGNDVVPVSTTLLDLDPAIPYYFRLVAENQHGRVAGALNTFQDVHEKRAATSAPGGASLLSNILAIVGFIILIVIIIWGLIHIATLTSPWFSSLFNNKTSNSIQVTAPANATSGDPFTVSWKYSTSAKGTYAFLYPCKSNFHFETLGANGAWNTIPCGASFTTPTTSNSLSVTPVLSGTLAGQAASTSVPISIIFMPSATGTSQAQGSATVAINPGAVQPVEPKSVVTATKPPTTVKKPYATGPADLTVRIVSINVDTSGVGTATFDIANVGGSTSGVYYFTAQIPTLSSNGQGQGYTYSSPAQSPLSAGSHVLNTLRFTQAMSGSFSVAVGASDINQSNNYASQWVTMPYYPNYNYNNYQNPQPQYPYYTY